MLKAVSIKYDQLIEGDVVEALKLELSTLAPTKHRMRHKDLGGVETALWIVLSYVGLKYVDAAVSEIAASHVRTIAAKLKQVFGSDGKQGAIETPPVTIVLELDDLDIELNLPTDTTVEFAEVLIDSIREEMQRSPLRDGPRIDRIHIPLSRDGDYWRECFHWSGSNYDYRYWGLDYFGYVTAAFDLQDKTVIDVPFDHLE